MIRIREVITRGIIFSAVDIAVQRREVVRRKLIPPCPTSL